MNNSYQQQQQLNPQNYVIENRRKSMQSLPPQNNNQPSMMPNQQSGIYNQPMQKNQYPNNQNKMANSNVLHHKNANMQQQKIENNDVSGGYPQNNQYIDHKNQDTHNSNYLKPEYNQKYSNNQIESPSTFNEPNNLNLSFNPSGQIPHNQQYPSSLSNKYFSQQQLNSDKQIISSQSINIPSLQNIATSSSQIQLQQQHQQQQLEIDHPIKEPSNQSGDKQDPNMIKSNQINNIYQMNGVAPYCPTSTASQVLNSTVGVAYRNPSIQSCEQLTQVAGFPSNTLIPPQKPITNKAQNQLDMVEEKLTEKDIFCEDFTDSEESYWDYQSPEDWQHLLPSSQLNQGSHPSNTQSQQNSRNKSKLGGNVNIQAGQNQIQPKNNSKRGNQQQNSSNQNSQLNNKQKDPFFGIDPLKLIVKDFPQGEDEESVFQWWDQIDDVYFPSKIKDGFFLQLDMDSPKNIDEILKNLSHIHVDENGITRRIPPIKQQLQQSQQMSSIISENSSIYYLMMKDHYKDEPIPYKQSNYLTVLYCDGFGYNDNSGSVDANEILTQIAKRVQNPQIFGYLAIYKLKFYDKKRLITTEDKSLFDQFTSQLEIISINNSKKIEECYQKLDYSIQLNLSHEHAKSRKMSRNGNSSIQRNKQDLSGYEPDIVKQFISSNQIIPIAQIQNSPQNLAQRNIVYDKNKITMKLKKLVSLDKSAIYSALQQSHFLDQFLKSKDVISGEDTKSSKSGTSKLDNRSDQDNDEEVDSEIISEYLKIQNIDKTPIECNILSLEYELMKLQVGQQMAQLKCNVIDRTKKEGDYIELRNLSVRINDNLKWLTIRKNLIHGFSDRIPYDSENYFNYESEEKTGINLAYSEIIKEKEMFELMTQAEQENMSYQRLQSAANELQIKQQQQQERMQRTKEKKEQEEEQEEQEEAGKSTTNNNNRVQKSLTLKDNEDIDEDVEDDEQNEDIEDAEEDSHNSYNKMSKQKDKNNRRRRSGRIQKIQEEDGNQNMQSNDNSIDGGDDQHESDRCDSPSMHNNQSNRQDYDGEDKKSELKNNKTSLSSNNNNNKKKKKQKQKNKNRFLETDCCVCFHHVNNENNTVVYCSQCNGSFHKHCYGIDFIPEEKFLCKKCEYKNLLQQQQKKRSSNSCANRPLKEEQTKQFQCKLCTETLLPVVSIYDDQYFYHPTCLFIFNYAIYRDQRLQLRDTVTHKSIAQDIKKQVHISCEFCFSKKGLKVKCCHFGKPRKSFFSPQINSSSNRNNVNARNPDQKQPLLIDEMKVEQNIDDKMEEEKETIEQSISNIKKEEDIKSEFQKESEEVNSVERNENIKGEENVKMESSEEEHQLSESDEADDSEEFGCNYYIHPLCAFLNGMEIWLDSRQEDKECERTIVESDFQNLQHLGLSINFKCKEHAEKRNRNYDEQTYYRRFQINYRNICQYENFPDYFESITKQRTSEEESWNELMQKEKEYKDNYEYYTKIKLNRKEIEISFEQSELFYKQNPHLKEQLQILEVAEQEEEAALKEEDNLLLLNQQNLQQQSLLNIEEDDEDATPNITQNNEEANTFDEIENRNNHEEDQDDEDDDEDNYQHKRRSRRHQHLRQQQLSAHKNQDNQDLYANDDNEYSNDDKKEGTRTRQSQQSSTTRRGQSKFAAISQTSLSGSQFDVNLNRRSRRLLTHNTKGKSQHSNFLNADEDEDNQDSSYNQAYSSFENILNKAVLKDNHSNQSQLQDQTSKQSMNNNYLSVLSQLTSITTGNNTQTQMEEEEEEEEFKGINRKKATQKQQRQIAHKGKAMKSSVTKYYDDDDEDEVVDNHDNQDEEEEEEYELVFQENFFDDDREGEEENGEDEEEEFNQKHAQHRGIGKQGRLKRSRYQRKSQQKKQLNDISSSSQENIRGTRHAYQSSRGASPNSKINGNCKQEEKRKVINNTHSIAKNGKIGKGTSIFAQARNRKATTNITSKGSLISAENEENELVDFDYMDEINCVSSLQNNHEQANDPINEEEPQQIPESKANKNKGDTQVSLQNIVDNQRGDNENQNNDVNVVQNKGQHQTNDGNEDEEETLNDTGQNSSLQNICLTPNDSKQEQRKQKSPSQPKNKIEMQKKMENEGDNQKQQVSNAEIPTQLQTTTQASLSKYNLRKHQSKNYKGSLIRDETDFINPHILNSPSFIQQQRQAFKNHATTNDNSQIEEETVVATTINQSSSSASFTNNKKQQSQASIDNNTEVNIQKFKGKNNQKLSANSSTKDQQLLNTEESSSNHLQNTFGTHQTAGNNENDFVNQSSHISNYSQEEAVSNEQIVHTKGKAQRKKQIPHKNELTQQKQPKRSSHRSKSNLLELEVISVNKPTDNSNIEEDNFSFANQSDNQIQIEGGADSTNQYIKNSKESQDLLDFDEFEQQDQILNPNNIKFS